MNRFIPTIDPLPQPAFFERLVFEHPAPGVAVLLLVALVTLVVMNRREQLRLGLLIAGALALAAAGLGAVGAMVQTDREWIDDGTRELVAAVAAGDAQAAAHTLAPDARLTLAGAGSFSMSRAELLRGVEALRSEVGVKGYGLLDRTFSADGPNTGRSRVVVRVDLSDFGPAFSSWEFGWRKEPTGEWRVVRMECLSINGRAPGASFAGELIRLLR